MPKKDWATQRVRERERERERERKGNTKRKSENLCERES